MRVIWDEQTGHANKADLVRPSRGDGVIYELWGNVEADNGRTYRVACYRTRHALRSTGEANRFAMASDDVAIRVAAGSGTRLLPEGNLPEVRAAVLRAFKSAYRAALDCDFDRDAPGFPAADESKRPENLARRNAEAARAEVLAAAGTRYAFNPERPYRVRNKSPQFSGSFDFPTLAEARAYLAAQMERRDSVIAGAAPVGPDANSACPMSTFIFWADGVETLADAPWNYRADGARPYGGRWSKVPTAEALEVTETPAAPVAEPETPAAPVRRDNVEYHAGRAAWQANKSKDSNPHLAGGERAARWNLGWQEACDAGAPVTIDATPTWAAVLPALVAVLEDGTAEGRRIAREELARMAEAADKWNASVPA